MAISKKLFLFFVLAAVAAFGRPARADEFVDASVSNMLAEQSERIRQLEMQLASLSHGQALHAGGCEDDACCTKCPGWIGGAEITFLKAHNNALSLSLPPFVNGSVIPGYDFEAAPRFWLGYEFEGGLGIRTTYWQFDQGVASNVLPLAVGLEATTVDVEVTQTGEFCAWDLTFAGGVRYGRIDDNLTLDLGDVIGLSREFEGVGGTISFGARREIGSRGFALIGSARASLLFGSTDATIDLSQLNLPVPAATLTNDQNVLEIYEIRLGGEWSRELSNGARFYTQLAYEAQAWNVAPIILGIGDSQIGFSGVAVNVGLAR